jgi:hypothetical protein
LKFFEKSANRKSTFLWVHSVIANPQILTSTSPQITNLQTFMTNVQIHKFSQNTAQLSQNNSKSRFFKQFLLFCSLNSRIVCQSEEKKYVVVDLRKSANHKKDWVRKSQTCKVPHLLKVSKSNKLFKSANLQVCDLRNLFTDLIHQLLVNYSMPEMLDPSREPLQPLLTQPLA